MTSAGQAESGFFESGPLRRLERQLGLVKPGKKRVVLRAVLVILIAWIPLATLTIPRTAR
jgi:hypothetical protein